MKRIAIYSRKSNYEENSNSTSNQIKIVKDYMSRYGECEFLVFEDEGFSGGNTKRPDFQRMLNMISNNKIDIVAVYKIDRIARNIVDFVNTYDLLQTYNVGLISVTEAFDLTTAMGKMILFVLATFAELERDNIKQRIKDNKIENAKLGRWVGGGVPLGYESIDVNENGKINKYLKIDESKAPIIRDLYSKFIELQNLSMTSKYMVKTYGILNTVTSLSRVLRNAAYVESTNEVVTFLKRNFEVYGEPNGKGLLLYGNKSKHKQNVVEFYAISKHDPIIDAETWLKVQHLISTRKIAQKNWSHMSFLSGLVFCPYCGDKMWLSTSGYHGKIYFSYKCHNTKSGKCSNKSIASYKLENELIEMLTQYTVSKKAFLATFELFRPANEYNKEKLIEKNIIKKTKEIEKLTEQLLKFDGAALEVVTSKINILSDDIKSLKEDLFVIEKSKAFDDNKNINYEYVFDQFKVFLNTFDSLSVEDKRLFLGKLIKAIHWDGINYSAKVII
jgi:site-specific DNA recombinase